MQLQGCSLISFWVMLQVMGRLVSDGYQVVTQQYLFPAHTLSREEAACVEYHIALASQKFVGNSVSSFSALLILERQRAAAWAAYYNGGNIPMSAAVPLYKLPWVFTFNSWSAKYDYMLKAAVRSAAAMGGKTLIPYCLFGGDDSSPIAVWLKVSLPKTFVHMLLVSCQRTGKVRGGGGGGGGKFKSFESRIFSAA